MRPPPVPRCVTTCSGSGRTTSTPGLSFDVAIRDRSVIVRVSAPLDLPVTVDGVTDTRVDARGAAVVEVGD